MSNCKHLPPTAAEFFRVHDCRTKQKSTVRNFHNWMRKHKIVLSKLTPKHLEAYLQKPSKNEIKESTRTRHYTVLKPYLVWLHSQNRLSFLPQGKRRQMTPLPPPAEEYVNTLTPVKKKTTCLGIICELRGLHRWLALENIPLRELNRIHMERWLQHLNVRGLSVTTRRQQIYDVGAYLRWLYENELIAIEPRDLLRFSDVPPKPKYLPRPFPPDADREIKKRLTASDHLYHQALLLMRCSGLRVGELLRLTPHCLEKDHQDNAFLKVPLGKLNSERLVPIDVKTRILLEKLQGQCPEDVEYLLEPERTRSALQSRLSKALKNIAEDLDTHGKVGTHRLRHTYATELMNAGMGLYEIMRLLGHHGIEMTMRYAALTQETVTRDYHAALTKIETKYRPSQQANQEPDPDRLLLDTIAWLRKNHCSSPSSKRTSDKIIKRIHRIRQDLSTIVSNSETR